MTEIGPNFPRELAAAGIAGLPFSWTSQGEFSGLENLTLDQRSVLGAVILAHDPFTPSTESARISAFKADTARAAVVARLGTATPAQIDAYFAGRTTMAQLRADLADLTKVLALVIRD